MQGKEALVEVAPPTKRKARGSSASGSDTRARADRPQSRHGDSDELDNAGRPRAPWHPLPLSELLILIGGIGLVIGVVRGIAHGGGPPALAGLAAAALGTIEVTWREHRGGFRSHATLLSLLPVVILHSLVIFVVSLATSVPKLLNVGMLAVDLVMFVVLLRYMRGRFTDARRSRVFSGQSRAR